MKRDKYLQALILMHVRDGKEHPELKKYSEQEQIYNGALLIEDRYVEGQVVQNSSGFPVSTSMTIAYDLSIRFNSGTILQL